MVVSFDLFGTLVTADRPDEPWDAVADTLTERGVDVPDDWETAYRSAHREYERGREAPLDEHVRLALASRGVEVTAATARAAVLAAFDGPVVPEVIMSAVTSWGSCVTSGAVVVSETRDS